MTRAYNTATTQQNSGGAVTPFAAGKNKIINGDMGVWQRGTNITAPSGTVTYGPDRFYMFPVHSSGTASMSQQTFAPGTAPVAGYEGQFFIRLTAGATGSPSAYLEFVQRIEDVRTFAGQTVTLSFWAKASTNVTTTPIIAQNFGIGGSSQVNNFSSTTTITTSWQRFTLTYTIPSISGKTIGSSSSLQVAVLVGNVTNSQTIDVWGVQVEAGPVATPFQTATGTLQGELAACQRYYLLLASGVAQSLCQGFQYATNYVMALANFPVTMRVTPTLSFTTGTNYYTAYIPGALVNFTGANWNLNTGGLNSAWVFEPSTGFGGGTNGIIIQTNNASARFAFSAEL